MSLKLKSVFLIAIINFIVTGTFIVIFYNIQKDMVLNEVKEKLKTAAFAIDEILPPDYHDRARTKDAISEKEYNQYLFELSKYAKKVSVYYLYTFVIINGKKYFTASSATDEEIKNKTYSKYFAYYPYNPAITQKTEKAMSPVFLETKDPKYGHFMTVYIPQWTKKGNKYYLGADINITNVQSKFRENLIKCIFIGVILFTLSILAGVWVANCLANPILRLSKYSENIIDENLNYRADIKNVLNDIIKRKDEIGKLAQSFNIMEKKLEDYITNLKKTTAAKEKIESELKIAYNIQRGFLPKPLTKSDTEFIELYASMYPSKEVGGDLYDYFILNNKLFFMIGDVSGKGVPAALFMSKTISLFRAFAPVCKTPSEILCKINNEIFAYNESMNFISLICGIYNFKNGEITYSNAGHLNPYIIKKDKTLKKVELPKGLVAGIQKDFKYTNYTLKLLKGENIIFYTDGVTEAFNSKGELFESEKLEKLLSSGDYHTVQDIVSTITSEIFNYSLEGQLADDMTVLGIKRLI